MQSVIARVSLSAILSNAEKIKTRAGVPLIAVVKDDAYGHGAERVALALAGRVRGFAVATVGEGAALRIAGVREEILVLTPPLCGEDVRRLAAYRLTATIASRRSLLLCGEAGGALRAHVAVNTGMNRFGVLPKEALAVCRAARAAGIGVTGLFSHFYLPADERAREEQYRLFSESAEAVRAEFPSALFHLSATGGMLAGRKYNFDAVRCGIALYGYLPDAFRGALAVQPALSLYAAVAGSGEQFGGGIGYRRAERAFGRLYTLRAGYGDGFFRAGGLGAEGELCMDACVCAGAAREGEMRCILRDMTEYAQRNGTTEYEALVRVTKRAVIEYV